MLELATVEGSSVTSALTNKAVGLARKGKKKAKKRKELAGTVLPADPLSKKAKESDREPDRGKQGLQKAYGVHISGPGTSDIKVVVGIGSNGT
jgi:hypothetical protein